MIFSAVLSTAQNTEVFNQFSNALIKAKEALSADGLEVKTKTEIYKNGSENPIQTIEHISVKSDGKVYASNIQSDVFFNGDTLIFVDKGNRVITLYDKEVAKNFLTPPVPKFDQSVLGNDSLVLKEDKLFNVFIIYHKAGKVKTTTMYFSKKDGAINKTIYIFQATKSDYVESTELNYTYKTINSDAFHWKSSNFVKVRSNKIYTANQYTGYSVVNQVKNNN